MDCMKLCPKDQAKQIHDTLSESTSDELRDEFKPTEIEVA